jgi:hypothetical protein
VLSYTFKTISCLSCDSLSAVLSLLAQCPTSVPQSLFPSKSKHNRMVTTIHKDEVAKQNEAVWPSAQVYGLDLD